MFITAKLGVRSSNLKNVKWEIKDKWSCYK